MKCHWSTARRRQILRFKGSELAVGLVEVQDLFGPQG